MLIKIFGNNEESKKLLSLTQEVLDEMGLSEFIKAESITDDQYKKNLGINKEPAFCIEEESIDFRDVIFEGVVPSKNEITALLFSIIGGGQEGGCSSGGCHSCAGSCGF